MPHHLRLVQRPARSRITGIAGGMAALLVSLAVSSVALAGSCDTKPLALFAGPGEPSDVSLGKAVAVMNDLVAVGAPRTDTSVTDAGVVRIYRHDTEWTMVAELTAPDPAPEDHFGSAIAFVDPDTIAIAAEWQDGFGTNRGAIYLFGRNGDQWTFTTKLGDETLPLGATMGSDILISDGTSIIAVSPNSAACIGCTDGFVSVFRRNEGGWTIDGTLVPAGGLGAAEFGASAAIEVDRILVGAPADSDAGSEEGAVYEFHRIDGAWVQVAKILSPDAQGPEGGFGNSVSLRGTLMMVGATGGCGAGCKGRVHIYALEDGAWALTQTIDGTWSLPLGSAIAIVDDTRAVAASQKPDRAGALLASIRGAWVLTSEFVPDPPAWALWQRLAASPDWIVVGRPNACLGPGDCPGAAFVSSLLPQLDCNRNLVEDACDAAHGLGTDANGNGLLDDCDDCNANGIPDQQDLLKETSADCNGNGNPDECDAASGTDGDCDADGLLDSCVIASGADTDCDGNGIPDQCDIAADPQVDCDGDGVLNYCEARVREDDGVAESALGSSSTSALDWMWLTTFSVEPGYETIAAAEVAWVAQAGDEPYAVQSGTVATVALLDDPTGDGEPADASVLVAIDFTSAMTAPSEFQRVDLPPTFVGAPGSTYFVAIFVTTPAGEAEFPIAVDETPPTVNGGWGAAWNKGLGGFDKVGQLISISSLGLDADVMLRAVADFGVLARVADLDCDGHVDAGDLGLLLADWGHCAGCAADLDGNGVVDGSDLGMLLADWG